MDYGSLVETIRREMARLDQEDEFQRQAQGWRERARRQLANELREALKQRRLGEEQQACGYHLDSCSEEGK